MLDSIKTVLEDISNVGDDVGEKILKLLKQNPKLSAKKMADKLKISSRQTERIIAKLKSQGKIIRIGSARSGYWSVK